VTPLYTQKLVLTWPTGGGRSVGIVRSRTKATDFFFNKTWYNKRIYIYKGGHYQGTGQTFTWSD